jgi:multiple sugar transport system permease protein
VHKSKIGKIITYLVLIFWAIVVYFPMYWVIISSFKLPISVMQGATYFPFLDFEPSLENYRILIEQAVQLNIGKHFANSAIIASSSAGIAALLGSFAAYGLVRFSYKLGPLNNKTVFSGFLVSRMVPPVTIVLAFLLMFNQLNLVDTKLGLIMAYVTFNLPLAVWIMRDAFADVPFEIEEAARIDGATKWQTFWLVTFPLVAGSFSAVFLMSFIFNWNEYLYALVLSFGNSGTVPILLAQSSTSRGVNWGRMSSLAVWSIIPSIIAGIILERFLRKGVMGGSIKG